jgi:predicted transcriptional regulator
MFIHASPIGSINSTGEIPMAADSTSRIALLSIQPKFAQLIMDGKKRIEFRKRRFAKKISHVVVYATTPIQKIIGYFEVDQIEWDSPRELWARYEEVGGILHEEFIEYYASAEGGIAICIGDVYALPTPLPLTAVGVNGSPPQSFSYITTESFEKLRQYC